MNFVFKMRNSNTISLLIVLQEKTTGDFNDWLEMVALRINTAQDQLII